MSARAYRRVESGLLAFMMLALFGMLTYGLLAFTDVLRGQDAHVPMPTHEDEHAIEEEGSDLVQKLKEAEIISDVLDEFKPVLTLDVTWTHVRASLGNTEDPRDMQRSPEVSVVATEPEAWQEWLGHLDARHEGEHELAPPQLTLAMTDPDAPSRENPENSEFCHWIATDLSLTERSLSLSKVRRHGTDVVSYQPPGPPPKTGKHRYVFVVLAPSNRTTEKLHLREPGERARWGYDEQRKGVRAWAEEMGLTPVGANFLYAQNDEQ